jgi:hypothetical protein
MVGKWYGSQPKKDGGYLEWIVDRALDGSYLVRFRLQEQDGNVREQAEVGEWGIAGPIYFSVFKAYVRENEFVPVDPTNPYNRNAYKILELSEETFIYEEFNTKNKYTAKRVPETFDFRPK